MGEKAMVEKERTIYKRHTTYLLYVDVLVSVQENVKYWHLSEKYLLSTYIEIKDSLQGIVYQDFRHMAK